jgi:hypothetical protein
MMAGSRDDLQMRPPPIFTDERADFTPGLTIIQSVHGMAGGHARFATAALVEVDFESELFIRTWRPHRQKMSITRGVKGTRIVQLGKAVHRGQLMLIVEQISNQIRIAFARGWGTTVHSQFNS